MSSDLKWFRLYADAIDNDRLRLLAFEDRWHFVALLCCKAQGILDGEPTELVYRRVAVKLGVQLRELDEIIRRLAEVGLIHSENLQPRKWAERQFESDTSRERTRAWRERLKQKQPDTKAKRHSDVTVTAQDTDTDTEKETSTSLRSVDAKKDAPASSLARTPRAIPKKFPDDWTPSPESIAWIESHGVTLEDARPAIIEFKNYWHQRKTLRADWDRTFRNSGPTEASLIRIREAQRHAGNRGHRKTASERNREAGEFLRSEHSRLNPDIPLDAEII